MRNCAFLCTPNNSKVNNALHLLPNPIVAQFILVSVNALAFSVLPQSKFPLLTMASALSQAAHRFSRNIISFLASKAQCDDAIEIQMSEGSLDSLLCSFPCTRAQCSRKAERWHSMEHVWVAG